MLTQARRALEYLHPDNLTFRFAANWALASAYYLQGDRAASARACMEGLSISQRSGELFSTMLALSDLGQLQELETQLYRAARTYERVLSMSGDHPQPNAGEVHLGLARIYYEWNDLQVAEQHGRRSLELARQYDRVIDRFVISEVFLARLKLAQGDVEGAAALLARVKQTVRQKNFVQRMPEVAAAQVPVLLRQGDLAAAGHLAQTHSLPLGQARVLLARENRPQPWRFWDRCASRWRPGTGRMNCCKVMVLQAIALHGGWPEGSGAASLLGKALALAEPGGFVRIFVDEGPRILLSCGCTHTALGGILLVDGASGPCCRERP